MCSNVAAEAAHGSRFTMSKCVRGQKLTEQNRLQGHTRRMLSCSYLDSFRVLVVKCLSAQPHHWPTIPKILNARERCQDPSTTRMSPTCRKNSLFLRYCTWFRSAIIFTTTLEGDSRVTHHSHQLMGLIMWETVSRNFLHDYGMNHISWRMQLEKASGGNEYKIFCLSP